MQKANDRQVGGTHYRQAFQHWDWVPEIGMGYLDGTASKYLCRWKDKGGLQDLEKGLHYVEKLEEESRKPNRKLNAGRSSDDIVWAATLRVCREHKMPWDEMDIMFRLATWRSPSDLLNIISLYAAYVEKMKAEVTTDQAKPVPLTEENHYGERAIQEDPSASFRGQAEEKWPAAACHEEKEIRDTFGVKSSGSTPSNGEVNP